MTTQTFGMPPTPQQAAAASRGLQLFEYSGQQVRTLTIENEPWFVLADACKILGIANPSDAATRLDSDDLATAEVIDSMGRTQTARIVNESGLYDLAFMSRKPEARDFKRWVTRVVLPEIRKTGSFVPKPKTLAEQALEVISGLQELAAAQAKELEAARPLAEHTKHLRQSAGLETVGDIANRIQAWAAENAPGYRVLHKDVWDLAGELNILIRGNTVRHNRATSQALAAKWVRESSTEIEHNSGEKTTKYTVRLTHKGAGRIWDAALARIQGNQPIFVPKNKKEA